MLDDAKKKARKRRENNATFLGGADADNDQLVPKALSPN